jgi:hypothetical protein
LGYHPGDGVKREEPLIEHAVFVNAKLNAVTAELLIYLPSVLDELIQSQYPLQVRTSAYFENTLAKIEFMAVARIIRAAPLAT